MKREEILERSRKENGRRDLAEMEVLVQAGSTASRAGMLCCCLISLLQTIFTGQFHFGSWCIYFSMLGTKMLVKYLKLKRRHELAIVAFYLLLAAGFLTGYVLELMGRTHG